MPRRRRAAAIALVVSAIVAGPQAAAPQTAIQADPVDEFVAAELDRQQIPGLSIAVLRDGELLKAQGYGLANVEHNAPATADTVYQSASVGKQFTAALVMLLVDEGELELDDRLVEHIEDAPAAWSEIEVRHMLNHTAGLSNAVYQNIDFRRDYDDDALIREIAALPLDFAAGERWSYSNSGYVLLGVLVRRVTGAFYGDLLREKIFAPLGMTTARIISETDIVPNRAAGYELVDGALKNQQWVAPTLNTTADGALYLTVLDMAKWDTALRRRELLSDEAFDLLWSPAELNDGSTAPYGFGWALGEVNGQRTVQHGGRWQGFSSYITRFDNGLTVIVLANLAQANTEWIAGGIAGLYDPGLAREGRAAVTVDPVILGSYVGEYELAPGEVISLSMNGDTLVATAPGQGAVDLRPASENLFFIEGENVEIELVKNGDGAVTHLILRPNGQAMEARRLE